jgi:hypothetical protein
LIIINVILILRLNIDKKIRFRDFLNYWLSFRSPINGIGIVIDSYFCRVYNSSAEVNFS